MPQRIAHLNNKFLAYLLVNLHFSLILPIWNSCAPIGGGENFPSFATSIGAAGMSEEDDATKLPVTVVSDVDLLSCAMSILRGLVI
jgi:hypothetical protein